MHKTALVCLTLILFFGLAALLQAGMAQAAPEQDSAASRGVADAWSVRSQDLDILADEINTLEKNAQALIEPLALRVDSTRMEISRLMGLYQAAHGYPSSQLTLFLQMRGLSRRLQDDVGPFQLIADTVQQHQEEIKRLQDDVISLDEVAAIADLPEIRGHDLVVQRQYQKRLLEIARQSAKADAKLERIMAPAQATIAKLNVTLDSIGKTMPDLWRNYYLSSFSIGLDSFVSLPQQFSNWLGSVSSRLSLAFPNNPERWLESGKNFLLVIVALGLLGIAAYKGSRKLPGRWAKAGHDIFTGAWIWVTGGWAILVASGSSFGNIYFGFLLPGVLIIVWGISQLSWRLRQAATGNLDDHPSPLARLYLPAALGVLLLYSDINPRILSWLWITVMLVFSGLFFCVGRKIKVRSSFIVENISYKGALFFTIVSLLMSLGGYARLAVLLFMFLFALVNIMTLGSAISALASMFSDRLFVKYEKPVRNALAHAVGIPASWIFSLLCTVPWLWAVPGASYIFEYVLSTRYEIGDASVDLSRILLIAVMFFLCRSFIHLGKTSLAQLPNRMPHMEKGVIPPLQHMLGYILWAVLAILILGIVGVDLTSLAVVAGGLSVGIGFGLQNLFSNLISGIMLIFGRTVLIGDYVSVGGVEGTVKAIQIRSLVIETLDKAMVFVPNSTIMAGQFINWTRNNLIVRKSVSVGVAYGTDTGTVSNLLLEIAAGHERVLKEPAPFVLFEKFADSSLDFTLYIYVDDFSSGGGTASDLRHKINRIFMEKNIDIAFPQLDVHLEPVDK
ncbi:MAG: mechanosensitive ion channel [Desulfarculales bacterium]|jgi:small-conductance mechanosensitive channel|nr:mechanosensitive ion channel [Desulfarculales bacterium]